MTKWHSAKESPDLYEWIVAEWYDGDEYVKRNNITKWCYIKDIKD